MATEEQALFSRRLARRFLLLYVPVATVALVLALTIAFAAQVPGEEGFMRALQSLDWPGFATLMVAISALGYAPLSFLIPALVAAALAVRRYWMEIVVLAFGLLSNPAQRLLKELVGRERPSPELFYVYSIVNEPSFPSGHVVYFMTFYGFLLYWVVRRWRPSPARAAVVALLLGLLFLVGVSRVYLGAHYPADVAGGYLIGSLWLAMMIEIYRARRPR